MINWKVRIRNEAFWMAFIPAVLLLVQSVAAVFGFTVELSEVGKRMVAIVNEIFALLSIVGVINDPTTAGLEDSAQAMTYEQPKE